ncbi:MAG: hypothetical protein ACFFAO_13520 [Candidatus Hermodarchaeota archaeon]
MAEKTNEFKINEYTDLMLKDGKAQLHIRNTLFRQDTNLLLTIPIDNLECKINDFITLRLENNKVSIYIKGKKAVHFRSTSLRIPFLKSNSNINRNVIYEPRFQNSLYLQKSNYLDIPPEIMFWTLSSKIQRWVEHNYKNQLLYFKLSFTLLRKLNESGDPIAKKVMKEEIGKAFEQGNASTIAFLMSNFFLDYLSLEEIKTIFNDFDIKTIENQSPMVKILLFEQLYFLGIEQEKKALKAKITREVTKFSKTELIELFAVCFSSYAKGIIKKKIEKKMEN